MSADGSVEALTYTVAQAAVAVGVCGDTVRLMIDRGDLPALRIGRRILISRAALADWMASNANATFPGRDVPM